MDPMTQAAVDALIAAGFSSATMIFGLKIGYKERRKDEKVEKHNKEIEARNDRRNLKY